MSNYSDTHPNRDNINNFNEGLGDHDIRERRLLYQYNGLSPRGNEHVDRFPDETFKTVLPSTRIAHRQLRHTPQQVRQQAYPLCVVNPRVSLSGLDNRLAAGSFATTTWSSTSNRFQNRSEMPELLVDPQKKIVWRGKVNRVVVMLDFVLAFRSYAEQLNWSSYLINTIPTDGGFFDIDTALELAIPDGFLEETAKYAGIPVKDDKGSVAKFVDYLNMNSEFPISYRFSSGRHKDAFYMHYSSPILCNIGDLSYSNGTSRIRLSHNFHNALRIQYHWFI